MNIEDKRSEDDDTRKYEMYQVGNVIYKYANYYLVVGQENGYNLVVLNAGYVNGSPYDSLKELADSQYTDDDQLVTAKVVVTD